MPKQQKLQRIPEGVTVVLKKNPKTGKLEPTVVKRKAYTKKVTKKY